MARDVRAVLASPLPYNQAAVGVVAVLSEQRHPWSPEGELALLAFTDLAALFIASMMQGERQSELAGHLQGALDSRKVIEQAKGVLMGKNRISAKTPTSNCAPGPGRAPQAERRLRGDRRERRTPGDRPRALRGALPPGRRFVPPVLGHTGSAVMTPPRPCGPMPRRCWSPRLAG